MHRVQPRGESLHPASPTVLQMVHTFGSDSFDKARELEITRYHQYEHKIC